MGCNPDCYTKGRGCVAPSDGRCIFYFAKQGEPNYLKTSKEVYSQNLDKFIKEASEKARKK